MFGRTINRSCKQIIFIFVLPAAFFFQAHSQEVDLQQARSVYKSHFSSETPTQPGKKRKAFHVDSITQRQTTTLYIFSQPNRHFALIAADKRIKPLLGYSKQGGFNRDSIPPQLKDLLNFYSRRINTLKNSNQYQELPQHAGWSGDNPRTDPDKSSTSLQPFLDVQWDQGAGWNQYCPVDSAGPGNHVMVGCVAVAMGQAMSKYHHPDTGEGSYSMGSDYGVLEADFGDTHYQWEQMSSTSPDRHNALLLYHLGVSVNMQYGPQSSGAYTREVTDALKKYFDYSPGIYYSAKFSDTRTWIDTLKSQLDRGIPIIYSGDNNQDAGHAFNLDGYNTENQFHINWGWNGQYNGYYSLGNLTPGDFDFSYGQGAVLSIRPFDHSPRDIGLSSQSVMEGQGPGTPVGAVEVTDPDTSEQFTFAVESMQTTLEGESPSLFYIEGDSLKTDTTFQYHPDDHRREIKITVEDKQGNTLQKSFDIEILPMNHPPQNINLSDTTLRRGAAIGTVVGKLNTEDPDQGDAHHYTLARDTIGERDQHNNFFGIRETNQLTLASRFNYDLYDQLSVYIRSTDPYGADTTQSFNINLIRDTSTVTSSISFDSGGPNIEAYPNPVSRHLKISIPPDLLNSHLMVYGPTGKLIHRRLLTERTADIDAGTLRKGINIVIIRKGNQKFYSKRIFNEP